MLTDHHFILFTKDHSYLVPTLAALCRLAQGEGLTAATVWRCVPGNAGPLPMVLRRDGATWRLCINGVQVVDEHEATSLDDPRALAVISAFEAVDAHVNGRPVPPALWACAAFDPSTPNERRLHPLGYHEPVLDEAGAWSWEYCPEVVAETTAGLDDYAFTAYLGYIRLRVMMRMNNPDVDPGAMQGMVDVALVNAGPFVAGIVTQVELRVLDR